ncbi:hypothetical protein [Priestia megaterium]|nr:hypothetical protein [Priestia megaterium]
MACIGLFIDLGPFSSGIVILGFLTMAFYEDLKKTFWDVKKDFTEQ